MKSLFTIIAILLFTQIAFAQTAQWRGPMRDGHFPASGLLKSWPETGPERILLVEDIGKGYSSAVFDEGHIYISGMKDSMDYLSTLDLKGNLIWQVPYGKSWVRTFPDTRSTPTIDKDRIYLVSGIGELVCLNRNNGSILWTVNVDEDYEGIWPRWGVSESPLIVDEMVICTPGGEKTSMVAFNKENGKLLWQTECVGGERIYASPQLYDHGDHKYILGMTSKYLFAVIPETGKIVWSFPYYLETERSRKRGAPFTNTPIFKDNEIFITSGYDMPAIMLSLGNDGLSVEKKWIDTTFDNHHHGVVLLDGMIYGSNWENNKKGNWVCMDWQSGEIKYEYNWGTKGSIIAADGLLYLYEEKSGNVGLLKPNPEKFDLISSFKVEEGTGPYWSHPSIYDGKLFLRHGEVLLVYDLKA